MWLSFIIIIIIIFYYNYYYFFYRNLLKYYIIIYNDINIYIYKPPLQIMILYIDAYAQTNPCVSKEPKIKRTKLCKKWRLTKPQFCAASSTCKTWHLRWLKKQSMHICINMHRCFIGYINKTNKYINKKIINNYKKADPINLITKTQPHPNHVHPRPKYSKRI